MPIYEYLCEDCTHTFEVKQSIKDDPVAHCARCGKSAKRIISAPAIMFKGSGWYITDYSDKMKPPSSESSDSTTTQKTDAPKKDATESSPATPAAPVTSPAASSSPPSSSGTAAATPQSTGTPATPRPSTSS